MKVKELIKELLDYNMEAEVKVVANNKKYDYSIAFGGKEGVEKHNTKEVSFYVDELCTNEQVTNPLLNPLNHSIEDLLKEIQFGRPAETQLQIQKWIDELKNK